MPIDRSDPTPVYAQIANEITSRIRSGRYRPGSRLPAQTDLGEEFGASRMTVIAAIQLLDRRGLVDRQHGVGVFVREDVDLEQGQSPVDGIRRDVLALADDIERGIGYRIMPAEELIATVVGLLRELAGDGQGSRRS